MKKASIKTNNADSPKTPGGISKSFLTPCRRLGLSRNWKRSGSSPFISPLSSADKNTDAKQVISPLSSAKKNIGTKQDDEGRKRKSCSVEELDEYESKTKDIDDDVCKEISCKSPEIDSDRTPTRTLSHRKKSKSFLIATQSQEVDETVPQNISDLNSKSILIPENSILQQDSVEHVDKVTKLSRKNSKLQLKMVKSPVKLLEEKPSASKFSNFKDENNSVNTQINGCDQKICIKKNSPNNLTKECIVVIQRKLLKTVKSNDDFEKEKLTQLKSASQTLFDSDDEAPLCLLNKREVINKNIEWKGQDPKELTHDDCDFVAKNTVYIKKLENKTTSTSGLKTNVKEKTKMKSKIKAASKSHSQSSNSFEEDDDDFDYGKKRTIIIKKTYEKTTKPLKSKSTGSITQKDIDEIKARIESKKNLLLAKAKSSETRELRELIKKWQLSCQTALMELLELMKRKMPEQNMEHSELLQMLKIPPDLVGYDSDSDTYKTPNDSNIILSVLKLD